MFNWNIVPLACNSPVVSFLSFLAQILPILPSHHLHLPLPTPLHKHTPTHKCTRIHAAHSNLFFFCGIERMTLLRLWRGSELCCSMEGDVVSPAALDPAMKVCAWGYASFAWSRLWYTLSLPPSTTSLPEHDKIVSVIIFITVYIFVFMWMNDAQFRVCILSL